MQGKVSSIYISTSANAELEPLKTAQLHAGKGIVGDRYYTGKGTFSEMLAGNPAKELTLIESEEIDAFNKTHGLSLSPASLRRNIITSDIRLNELVGKTFYMGDVELLGIRLCEPCPHLADILTPKVIPGLLGKAGLRASIKSNGTIKPDDIIHQ